MMLILFHYIPLIYCPLFNINRVVKRITLKNDQKYLENFFFCLSIDVRLFDRVKAGWKKAITLRKEEERETESDKQGKYV